MRVTSTARVLPGDLRVVTEARGWRPKRQVTRKRPLPSGKRGLVGQKVCLETWSCPSNPGQNQDSHGYSFLSVNHTGQTHACIICYSRLKRTVGHLKEHNAGDAPTAIPAPYSSAPTPPLAMNSPPSLAGRAANGNRQDTQSPAPADAPPGT